MTNFNYSAQFWTDENLPLEFQFSYIDPSTGSILVVREKGLSPYATSYLPSGPSSRKFLVNCSLVVNDAISASTSQFSAVRVRPVDHSTLNSYVSSQLLSITISAGAINLIGTILNKVNCTGMNFCSSLNRLDCSSVDFTCGNCKAGFIGQIGPGNSFCLDSVMVSKFFSAKINVCHEDSDCPIFQVCNISSNVCYLPLKNCPSSCSFQGNCTFVNNYNGNPVAICTASSTDCSAVCNCNPGFAGSSCAMSSSQLAENQQQRNEPNYCKVLEAFWSPIFQAKL